jgi:type 1 glutamine amidotransferase
LQPSEIALFRNFVKSGKGVVGIRTASHAFCLRPPAKAPAGTEQWPEFDRDVFGGNYSNHFGDNDKPTIIWHVGDPKDEILAGLKGGPFQSSGSLYKVSPIVPSCRVLALGQLSTGVREPVAWTFIREDGGRSVYTSLGHEDDFKNAEFRRFLVNAIRWAAARQSNKGLAP